MEFLLIGLATAFNLLIIKHKLERHRYEDGIFDLAILCILTLVFSGSYGGLVVATISSAIISLYFLASPPKFFGNSSAVLAKFKSRITKRRRKGPPCDYYKL